VRFFRSFRTVPLSNILRIISSSYVVVVERSLLVRQFRSLDREYLIPVACDYCSPFPLLRNVAPCGETSCCRVTTAVVFFFSQSVVSPSSTLSPSFQFIPNFLRRKKPKYGFSPWGFSHLGRFRRAKESSPNGETVLLSLKSFLDDTPLVDLFLNLRLLSSERFPSPSSLSL